MWKSIVDEIKNRNRWTKVQTVEIQHATNVEKAAATNDDDT